MPTKIEEKKTYNGWTNYETWNVALWIGNDQGSQQYWDEQARAHWENGTAEKPFTREEQAALDLSKEIQSSFEDNTPTVTGCYADLLNSALSEVNWYEIAESILENIDKN